MNAVLEEDTSDHTDGKIVVEVDKHQEALEVQDETILSENTYLEKYIQLNSEKHKIISSLNSWS